jgi:hypothetical protein
MQLWEAAATTTTVTTIIIQFINIQAKQYKANYKTNAYACIHKYICRMAMITLG